MNDVQVMPGKTDLEDAMEQSLELRELVATNPLVARLYEYARKLSIQNVDLKALTALVVGDEPAPAGTRRPCKACGAPLLFARGEGGRDIPLDTRAPVYEARLDPDETVLARKTLATRSYLAFVNHFCTCTRAQAFIDERLRRA